MLRLLLAAVPFLLAALLTQDPTPAPAAIEWHEDFAAARALAGKEHRPLFVTFRCER